MTDLSVLVNTRDRAASLRRLLGSLAEVDVDGISVEVVVVDNASSDDTPRVVADAAASCSYPVHYAHEPTPGASRAKNTGLRLARGRLLAFTDDDCVVEPTYARAVVEAFALERFDYCGGRSLLLDPADAPYAIKPSTSFRLIPPRSFVPAGAVLGLNMAWRAEVVRSLGGFDPMFGPGTPYRGDEIDLCARASHAGHWGAFVPSILVYHGHGRKPGSSELRENQRGDDVARGAYYASCLLRGRLEYIPGWIRTSWRHRDQYAIGAEVGGAVRYTLDRLRRMPST